MIRTLSPPPPSPLRSSGTLPCVALVHKLVAVLESQEKLPLVTHDTPGAPISLQVRMGCTYICTHMYVHTYTCMAAHADTQHMQHILWWDPLSTSGHIKGQLQMSWSLTCSIAL